MDCGEFSLASLAQERTFMPRPPQQTLLSRLPCELCVKTLFTTKHRCLSRLFCASLVLASHSSYVNLSLHLLFFVDVCSDNT